MPLRRRPLSSRSNLSKSLTSLHHRAAPPAARCASLSPRSDAPPPHRHPRPHTLTHRAACTVLSWVPALTPTMLLAPPDTPNCTHRPLQPAVPHVLSLARCHLVQRSTQPNTMIPWLGGERGGKARFAEHFPISFALKRKGCAPYFLFVLKNNPKQTPKHRFGLARRPVSRCTSTDNRRKGDTPTYCVPQSTNAASRSPSRSPSSVQTLLPRRCVWFERQLPCNNTAALRCQTRESEDTMVTMCRKAAFANGPMHLSGLTTEIGREQTAQGVI